jgi:hypothetical protein
MQNSSDPDGYRAHPQQPTRLHHHRFRSHICAKDQVELELAGLTAPNAMASPERHTRRIGRFWLSWLLLMTESPASRAASAIVHTVSKFKIQVLNPSPQNQ